MSIVPKQCVSKFTEASRSLRCYCTPLVITVIMLIIPHRQIKVGIGIVRLASFIDSAHDGSSVKSSPTLNLLRVLLPNALKDERLYSHLAGFSGPLIMNPDLLSYAR